MIKVFLSHSSKDKAQYIRQVALTLKRNNIIYDELTFDPGMRAIEEILSGIDSSSLFVVFLSVSSIESDWVKKELAFAKEKLEQDKIDRIYPVLIDGSISYSDSRIPVWMKEEYNLRLVVRPAAAARKIQQRLREISWKKHPILKERNKIFVGRNDIIQSIEERMDDFDRATPSIVNASGLSRIGRSSVLKSAIEKCNIVDGSYESPHIYLSNGEFIEDLIVKLYDLGLSEEMNIYNLISTSYEEKLNICYKLVDDIQKHGDILLIHDDGCLIDYKGDVRAWFNDLASRMQKNNKLQWVVASTKRMAPQIARRTEYIFSVNIPELSIAERKGLFRRALQIYSIDLTSEEISKFSDLLTGFPDQVFFSCEQIADFGVDGAWKKSHEITAFNSERASIILASYSENQNVLDFIYLLSKFEFISQAFLFSIEERPELQDVLSELIVKSICDYVGSDKEFVRLNDSVRDYIQRNKLGIPRKYASKLESHLREFLESPSNYEDDISDILYSIKEAIKTGKVPPEKYLIPSHFLKSIRELYHNKKHLNKVIELSDKFLQKESALDKDIVQEIRYYLCLALARKRDKRFLTEVHKIDGPELNFLMGFYYRLTNRPKEAIDRFNKCLKDGVVANRTKRELVQVLISVDDYQAAASLAKDNYDDYPNNLYHIQAYLNTIIHSNDRNENMSLVEKLIDELYALGTEKSKEMAEVAKAEYFAKCKNDYSTAITIISDAVLIYPDSHYPALSKAFLAARYKDEDSLIEAYDRLKRMSKSRYISNITMYQIEASIMAIRGEGNEAVKFIKSKLKTFPEKSLQEVVKRLQNISSNKSN